MKLKDVVVQGRFCGLNTVGECVANFELHMMQVFPYSQIPVEYKELLVELAKYENGELELDWNWIDEEVKKANKEYYEWHLNNVSDPIPNDLEAIESIFI